MDDSTLGGSANIVFKDLKKVFEDSQLIGMELNLAKCKIFVTETVDRDLIISRFNMVAPGIKILNQQHLNLLGTPLTDQALPAAFRSKIES